jgi:hypothetical protein
VKHPVTKVRRKTANRREKATSVPLRAIAARMTRRVRRVDEDGWAWGFEGKRLCKIGTTFRLGTCAYCGATVAPIDRSDIRPEQREACCEVCRADAKAAHPECFD